VAPFSGHSVLYNSSLLFELDSMRWFSHRRSCALEDRCRQIRTQAAVNVHCLHSVTPGGHTKESSAAACSERPTAHASPYYALSMGMTQQFFVFVPGNLDLWPLIPKFELGWDFCTVHLTAKFHHPMFNRSNVIMRTIRQTNKLTNRRRWKHPPRSAMLRWWLISHNIWLFTTSKSGCTLHSMWHS